MKTNWEAGQIALLFITLIFSGCNPDKTENDPEPALEEEPCRLTKIINYDVYYHPAGDWVEYLYDSQNRIIQKNFVQFDSTLNSTVANGYYTYQYTNQGKVLEKKYFAADGTLYGKSFFTYNNQNLLIQIEHIGEVSSEGNYDYLIGMDYPARIELQYNALGQRTRANFYENSNPNVMAFYFDYTYLGNKIVAKQYDPRKNPVKLVLNWEFIYDTGKCFDCKLGYLGGLVPELDKKNIERISMLLDTNDLYKSFEMQYFDYNYWGYPNKRQFSPHLMAGQGFTKLEYNCQ